MASRRDFLKQLATSGVVLAAAKTVGAEIDRKYLVYCEPYDRFHPPAPWFKIYSARSLEDLVMKIDKVTEQQLNEDWDGDKLELLRHFEGRNGDGWDYYEIRELLPNNELGVMLIGYEKGY